MDNFDLACLFIEAAHILTEGAVNTSKKKKLDKYLSKYGYKGDSKIGEITVNGKKYIVDRDTKSKTAVIDGEALPRQTMTKLNDDSNTIYLDENFGKLKNDKRRDAVLNHEIGHLNLHKLSGKGSTDKHRENSINAIAKQSEKNPEIRKEITKQIKNMVPDSSRHNYTKNDKIKIDNLNKFKKYEDDNNEHANAVEFEADAYSSAQKNGDHLKRGIREYYKRTKSDRSLDRQLAVVGLKGDEKIKNEVRKNFNKIGAQDMRLRAKALKDKSINKQVYRECADKFQIDPVLIEVVELLCFDD